MKSRRPVNSTVSAQRCVRTASGSDPIEAQLEWMIPSLPLRVQTRCVSRSLHMRRELRPPVTLFVALLRGINVGGKNLIRMGSLKTSFERMGFEDVTTYINSGNIIFKAKEGDARKLETKIEVMLSREYKLECKVVVRSFSEIANLVKKLPKNWDGDQQWKYNVIFLRHSIDSEKIFERLEPKSDIEQVIYCPGALLWSARISDWSRTDIHKLASRSIYQDMTVRNINTARKLYVLMKEMSEA